MSVFIGSIIQTTLTVAVERTGVPLIDDEDVDPIPDGDVTRGENIPGNSML